MKKAQAQIIIQKLGEKYPQAGPELEFGSNYQLLVAVVLSAQCTDKRVNMVTRELFKEHGTPQAMLKLTQTELEEIIKPCGLYKNKAKNILSLSRAIITEFDGQVPNTVNQLKSLNGVGQKTANVVYSVAFSGDAIAVDTHVFRLARRIGFSTSTTPAGVEKDLCRLIDKALWSKSHHYLIWHGRRVCKAQKPDCQACVIKDECQKNFKNKI